MERAAGSHLVPLNGNNYPTWKLQVKMALMKEDLFRIVDGTEQAPTEAPLLVKFNLRRDRALATLVLSVEPKLLYLQAGQTWLVEHRATRESICEAQRSLYFWDI